MDTVANSVYELRSSHGFTQEELAQAAGVSRQTILAIEKGNYTPSVALALRIARVFKVPVEKVFSLTNKK